MKCGMCLKDGLGPSNMRNEVVCKDCFEQCRHMGREKLIKLFFISLVAKEIGEKATTALLLEAIVTVDKEFIPLFRDNQIIE